MPVNENENQNQTTHYISSAIVDITPVSDELELEKRRHDQVWNDEVIW